ncbi:sulfatase [Acidimicrobiales bacterium]|nr:sulfatase [Acidimicrobiales bacterium]
MESESQPNLVFIMSDDHAAHAISAYGSRINHTPNLDRIATEGMRLDAAFCTNSICAPSRAAILTGTYNHVNGVTTLETPLDNTLWNFPGEMQRNGWQTAMIGKWHLGHGAGADPSGFDHWRILPGQGHYHNPVMLEADGVVVERGGYVTDLITDDTISWIDQRDRDRPFAVFCHHKAPHRTWEPAAEHFTMYDDVEIPFPDTFRDDLRGRAEVIQAVRMRMMDLDPIIDLKATVPPGLTRDQEIDWRYQRYIKHYLRCVASIDDNVGRLLKYLDTNDLTENTIVVYTSDQGFFLGDHGWFDKRLMYEESLQMPMLVRYPAAVAPASTNDDMIVNVDVAQTVLDLCGLKAPEHVQGRSFASLLQGDTPEDWPTSMYYRYWMHRDGSHLCPAHYGVRTRTHKLICYYNDPLDQPGANGPADPIEWELFDLVADPLGLNNVWGHPAYQTTTAELLHELERLQTQVGDKPFPDATAVGHG